MPEHDGGGSDVRGGSSDIDEVHGSAGGRKKGLFGPSGK